MEKENTSLKRLVADKELEIRSRRRFRGEL
jgi:hypothetical protein